MSASTPATLAAMADRTDASERTALYAAGRPTIRLSVVVLGVRALLLSVAALVLGSVIDATAAGESIAVEAVWLALLLGGSAIVGGLWPRLAERTRSVVESDLRHRILAEVIRSPEVADRTGGVTNRATEGVAAVGSLAGKFLPQLVGGIIIPLLICAVVATVDVPAALVLLVAVPAVPVLLRGMESRFTSVTERYNQTADRLTARFFDGVQGMRTLRSLDAAEDYGRRLAAESDQLRDETMALLRVNQLALLIVDSLFMLGTVVAAGSAAVWRLQSGAITLGEAVAITLLGVALIEPISQIGRFFYVGAIGRAAAKDLKGFFADRVEKGFQPREGHGGEIRFEDVSFSYEIGRPILQTVSIEVRPGETLGLVGPSGAGKSTIAALVAGLLEPDAGTVAVSGRVALVSQHPYLFHGTVRENLQLADPSASDDQIWKALDAAELTSVVGERQGGLDLEVGERGLQLSGGEAQRLTIARLILADAPIVVLDEPTSSVDIETETRVRRALDRLMAGRTVVVIAHRKSTLSGVDRILDVSDGAVSQRMGVPR